MSILGGEDRNRTYTNGEITVYWKPGKCIHATTCYKELIEVFNPRKRPWINMDGAPTEKIIEIVDKCPTDALTWEYNSQSKTEQNNETKSDIQEENIAEVKVMEDGPIIIKGDFDIVDADGKTLKKMKIVSLCRCGNSMNMPYCDGTHRKVGFKSR